MSPTSYQAAPPRERDSSQVAPHVKRSCERSDLAASQPLGARGFAYDAGMKKLGVAAVFGSVALAAAGLFASGCSGTVVVDGGEGGSDGVTTSSSPTTSVSPTTTTTTGMSTSSGPIDGPAYIYESSPGVATFRVTTFGATCANPTQSPPFEQCDWAVLEIEFPISGWVAGTTYGPSSSSAQAFFQESGAGAPPDCPGTGGGGGLFGTFTIESVSDAGTVVTLAGWKGAFLDHEVDGTFTAENCAVPL